MPTPKKPNPLKLISGSRQPMDAPGVALPLVEGHPAPPDWLPNAHAVKEWNRLIPIMVTNRMLSEAALTTFAMMCGMAGTVMQIWAAGSQPQAALWNQYRALANDFGLTTVAQGRIKPLGNKEASNKFERFKDPG